MGMEVILDKSKHTERSVKITCISPLTRQFISVFADGYLDTVMAYRLSSVNTSLVPMSHYLERI